jgi:hypothetical protein
MNMQVNTPTNPSGTVQRGPLSVLGKNDAYDFTHTKYPASGLGSEVPNYMIFYINLPDPSKYYVTGNKVSGDIVSIANQNANITGKSGLQTNKAITSSGVELGAVVASKQILTGISSSVGHGTIVTDAADLGAKTASAGITGAAAGLVSEVAQDIVKKPRFNRIKEAVAIYMPDTVFHRYSHSYETASLTSALGDLGAAQRGAGALEAGYNKLNGNVQDGFGVGKAFGEVMSNPAATEAKGALAEATGTVGGGFTDFLLRSKGKTLNPQVEMMYRMTDFRSFIYEFKFQPRDKSEADTIKQIINTFRKYAAPEIATATNGSYYIPPGQFDIQYCFKDGENDYIGKVSTCVLEDISVNYSAAGQFATFTDGAPIDISMQLTFKEVEVITREIVDRGF